KTVPPEQMANWDHTRKKVAQVAQSVLGTAGVVTHELLGISVELLKFAPMPGLQPGAQILLYVWDAVEQVDTNFLECLGLTDRCAETLFDVRQQIFNAGDAIGQELAPAIAQLEGSFNKVFTFLQCQIHRSSWMRCLERDKIRKGIEGCETALRDALTAFRLSIQFRLLGQNQ
ncbi:hypothetical protein K443DRAFT_56506, partial [Laccaria amethystina LaAM-08-1]